MDAVLRFVVSYYSFFSCDSFKPISKPGQFMPYLLQRSSFMVFGPPPAEEGLQKARDNPNGQTEGCTGILVKF